MVRKPFENTEYIVQVIFFNFFHHILKWKQRTKHNFLIHLPVTAIYQE